MNLNNNNKYKVVYVALAGLPGTGKTTLARLSSRASIRIWYEKQLVSFKAASRYNNVEELLNDYSRTVEQISKNHKKCKNKALSCDKDIILFDRGFSDTLCYFNYMLITNFKDSAFDSGLLISRNQVDEITVFVTLNEDLRIRRINERRRQEYGRGLSEANAYWKYYREWHLKDYGVPTFENSTEPATKSTFKFIEFLNNLVPSHDY